MKSERESLLEMIALNRELAEKGYAPASGGNSSIRVAEGVLITRSGCVLKSLTIQDFVSVNESGEAVSGNVKPSKEVRFHLAIYRRNPKVNAVFHFHPPHCIAAGSLLPEGEDPIPAMVPYYVMRVRGAISLPYAPPGSAELFESIDRAAAGHQVIFLRNHGLVCSGETVLAAAQAVEETEENARIFLLTGGRGTPLSQEQCQWLKEKYWTRE